MLKDNEICSTEKQSIILELQYIYLIHPIQVIKKFNILKGKGIRHSSIFFGILFQKNCCFENMFIIIKETFSRNSYKKLHKKKPRMHI